MARFTGHEVTYQGIKCRAVKYRRTDGLSPEIGSVDINIKDLSSISLKMPQVLWRRAEKGKTEVPGQLGIDQTHRLYSGDLQGHQTVAEQKDQPGKGFKLVGQLTLESFYDGKSLGKATYSDIYVAFEGIEEITDKLANAKKHNEGFVSVPITDIRQFYTDYGLLFQDINCRLRSGFYDPRTVKQGGEPWSLIEVMQFLFSQLPGTPTIHPKSDVLSMSGNPPSEIIGEGEPVSGFITEILNQYGLTAKFLPDGNYLVNKKWIGNVQPGKISKSPGNQATWPYLKTEKKSISGTNRPPLVCVKGRRRVQRISVPYLPVIQWTDGKYYALTDIGGLIPGYGITDVNKQVLNNEHKNFQDVVLLASSGAVGYEWMQILRKQAYKVYAPANAFKVIDTPPTNSVATVGHGGISTRPTSLRVIDDSDVDFLAFLPAVDAPWYRGDLRLAGLDRLFKGQSSKQSSSGDFDEVVLLPPIVESRTIGEMWFQDAGEIAIHLKKVADSFGREKEHFQARVRICEERARSIIDHVNAANLNAAETIRLNKLQSRPLPTIEIDDEVRSLALDFGRFRNNIDEVLDDFGLGIPIKFALTQIKQELTAWKAYAAQADSILRKALQEVTTYQRVFAGYRGFAGKGNMPVKVAEQGKYSFDRRTGIIAFTEPQCVGQSTLVMTDEWQTVVSDGAVSAYFGYELRYNGIQDWTTVYISPSPSGPGKPATAAISGYSRPSGIKAKLERMPDVTMYLDESGNPMNLTFVTDAALRKAQFQVSIPDGVEGYHSIYHGFVPCVLDSGINGVQFEWEGGKSVPLTHVFQNYQGGVGPLGPAMVPTLSAAEGRARTRATIREIEER